ncbi:MAG: hypothetical protein AB4042_18070 [Leptolyngbyaceae cyanobacterium]
MDTPLVPLPLDSRVSKQSLDRTMLSQMVLYQFSEQYASQGQEVLSPPFLSSTEELGGRLSFELVKHVCGLTQTTPIQRSHQKPNTDADLTPAREAMRHARVSSSFAPPIMPMHQRDRTILDDLFERDDMSDIHTEITDQLGKMVKEPCWDDDPYHFLSDYL